VIKKQIEELISRINASPDDHTQRSLKHIQDFINTAVNYVKSVIVMESQIQILQFCLEPEEYREKIEKSEQNRRIIHNSLIAKINIMNRLCKKMGMKPLYQGPDNREGKGQFAFSLVEEYRIYLKK